MSSSSFFVPFSDVNAFPRFCSELESTPLNRLPSFLSLLAHGQRRKKRFRLRPVAVVSTRLPSQKKSACWSQTFVVVAELMMIVAAADFDIRCTTTDRWWLKSTEVRQLQKKRKVIQFMKNSFKIKFKEFNVNSFWKTVSVGGVRAVSLPQKWNWMQRRKSSTH